MVTRSGWAKRNAGNRTLLDFNFVKKKKITDESEDIYQSDEQVSGDKNSPFTRFKVFTKWKDLTQRLQYPDHEMATQKLFWFLCLKTNL